jgi:hypothetical protein
MNAVPFSTLMNKALLAKLQNMLGEYTKNLLANSILSVARADLYTCPNLGAQT